MWISTNPSPPDYEDIKWRQRATWASGDFGRASVLMQIVGESLCEAVDLRSSDNVLDVGAGGGNASLAAARRFADVTAIDYVPEVLEMVQSRAEAEGLSILTREADAESLPFTDHEFDVALSTFGVIFAPNPPRAAAELLRVVKPGGRIGLAAWTPDGLVGQLYAVIDRFDPRPGGVPSPAAWGTEALLLELFGSRASDIRIERRPYVFRCISAEHWIDFFRNHHGPVHEAFEGLGTSGRRALHHALIELLERFDRGGSDALVAPADYLEVVIRSA